MLPPFPAAGRKPAACASDCSRGATSTKSRLETAEREQTPGSKNSRRSVICVLRSNPMEGFWAAFWLDVRVWVFSKTLRGGPRGGTISTCVSGRGASSAEGGPCECGCRPSSGVAGARVPCGTGRRVRRLGLQREGGSWAQVMGATACRRRGCTRRLETRSEPSHSSSAKGAAGP